MYIKYIRLWRFIILKASVLIRRWSSWELFCTDRGLYSTCITYVIYITGMLSFMCTVLVRWQGIYNSCIVDIVMEPLYMKYEPPHHVCTIHKSLHCACAANLDYIPSTYPYGILMCWALQRRIDQIVLPIQWIATGTVWYLMGPQGYYVTSLHPLVMY